MNLINRIQSRFWKEARPLIMPVALGLLIPALAGSPLVRIRIIQDFAVPPEMVVLLFAVCLTFVCAVPFGYELSARTLPLFAAQPSRRWRLWLEKMLVMSLGSCGPGAATGLSRATTSRLGVSPPALYSRRSYLPFRCERACQAR